MPSIVRTIIIDSVFQILKQKEEKGLCATVTALTPGEFRSKATLQMDSSKKRKEGKKITRDEETTSSLCVFRVIARERRTASKGENHRKIHPRE